MNKEFILKFDVPKCLGEIFFLFDLRYLNFLNFMTFVC